MGELSELAKNRYKGVEAAPRFELKVAGRQVNRVRRISGSYVRESGSSTMTIEADFPFNKFEEEMVSLRLGYGDTTVEYFTGKLFSPDRHPTTGLATCEVKGPFASMQGSFGSNEVDYSGDTAAEFFVDLGQRSKQPGSFLEVVDGYDVVLEDAAFVRETELVEAAKTVTEKIGFVMLDRPGFKRKVMRMPAPGARAKSIARYDEAHYHRDAFRPVKATSVKYAKVVAFRRSESSAEGAGVFYPVYEEFPVANRGRKPPQENRIFWIPDFPGTPRQAANAAQRRSAQLSRASYTWELTDIAINPELLLFDAITCTRANLVDYRAPSLEIFSCLIDKQITFEIAPGRFHMTPSGDTALLTNVVPLAEIPEPLVPLLWRGIEQPPDAGVVEPGMMEGGVLTL